VKSIEVGMGGDSHAYKKTVRFYNTRYNPKSVKAKLYRMIARECDAFVQKKLPTCERVSKYLTLSSSYAIMFITVVEVSSFLLTKRSSKNECN
jgi:hypothetical protein